MSKAGTTAIHPFYTHACQKSRIVLVQVTGTWARLEEMKAVVCEPRGTGDAFDAVMADFYTAIRNGRGAIFFAICRGKVPSRATCTISLSSVKGNCVIPANLSSVGTDVQEMIVAEQMHAKGEHGERCVGILMPPTKKCI